MMLSFPSEGKHFLLKGGLSPFCGKIPGAGIAPAASCRSLWTASPLSDDSSPCIIPCSRLMRAPACRVTGLSHFAPHHHSCMVDIVISGTKEAALLQQPLCPECGPDTHACRKKAICRSVALRAHLQTVQQVLHGITGCIPNCLHWM